MFLTRLRVLSAVLLAAFGLAAAASVLPVRAERPAAPPPAKEAEPARGKPAPPCTDAEFIRRAYLDAAGILPTPEEVQKFVADQAPDKRAKLIDALLKRQALRKQLQALGWFVWAVDADKNTLVLTTQPQPLPYPPLGDRGWEWDLLNKKDLDQGVWYYRGEGLGNAVLDGVPVAQDAKVTIDGKEAKLANLGVGMRVSVEWAKDGASLSRVEAVSPPPEVSYTLKSVDAEKRLVTATTEGKGPTLEDVPVAKDAAIVIRRTNTEIGDGKLADLRPGASVYLRLSAGPDGIEIKKILADHRPKEK
jgi:hypothetical protein